MRRPLDLERSSPVQQLVVVARDRGSPPCSAETTVVLRLLDVNDNAPSVSVFTLLSALGAPLSGSGSPLTGPGAPISGPETPLSGQGAPLSDQGASLSASARPRAQGSGLGVLQEAHAEVAEDAAVGAFIAQVSVTDPDVSDNGRVECSLSDQTVIV